MCVCLCVRVCVCARTSTPYVVTRNVKSNKSNTNSPQTGYYHTQTIWHLCHLLPSTQNKQIASSHTLGHLKSKFIHLVVRLTTGTKPLPKRALHIVRSRASSFKWEYSLLSLRSSKSFLRLLPRLPVTSVPLLSFLQ